MFEQLARIERALSEHAPDVIDELRRAVDALDEIARSLHDVARSLRTHEREVIDGTAERVK